jgi:hypothetical protein
MGLLWVVGTLLAVGIILGLVMPATTRPPRCRDCGILASDVEEYELSASPGMLAVADRCPRCGASWRGDRWAFPMDERRNPPLRSSLPRPGT